MTNGFNNQTNESLSPLGADSAPSRLINAGKRFKLSLIVPCYNEENTIEKCVEKVREINKNQNFDLEIVIVNDCSTDKSAEKLEQIAAKYPEIKIFTHPKNRGKGAALRTGFVSATGDFVGIQDADDEYNPMEYIELLKPLLDNKADVVYGSRYLKPDTRRVLYFWHTWMNKSLTFVSNMFTNLDITDMETCYKLFTKEAIQKIAPQLKEERFGFEPEITAKVAQEKFRVYECAVSYNPRTYEEGKKIGWKDGIHALYCVFHYSAHAAPLPIMVMIYLVIGAISLAANNVCFVAATQFGMALDRAIITSLIISATCNYLLCVAFLFRHKARWSAGVEIFWYAASVAAMGLLDYGVTHALIGLIPFFGVHWSGAKLIASSIGFIGNFALRKWVVFPNKRKKSSSD